MKYIKIIICCTLMLGYSAAIAQEIQVIMKVLDLNSSDGDSDIPGFLGSDGWFKVDSYSSGISNPATANDNEIRQDKTTFKEMTIQIPHNALRSEFMDRLTNGQSINDLVIHTICTSCTGHNNQPHITTELKLVLFQNMNYDDINPLQYEAILQFGAIRRTYRGIKNGVLTKIGDFTWSRVKNNDSLDVE